MGNHFFGVGDNKDPYNTVESFYRTKVPIVPSQFPDKIMSPPTASIIYIFTSEGDSILLMSVLDIDGGRSWHGTCLDEKIIRMCVFPTHSIDDGQTRHLRRSKHSIQGGRTSQAKAPNHGSPHNLRNITFGL